MQTPATMTNEEVRKLSQELGAYLDKVIAPLTVALPDPAIVAAFINAGARLSLQTQPAAQLAHALRTVADMIDERPGDYQELGEVVRPEGEALH